MTPEEFSEAIRPLVEELKAIREVLAETQQDVQHLTRNMQGYLSAIADSSDEIRSEILSRLRYDNLPKPHLPPEETVTCAHCDAQADSLGEAVQAGFTRLQLDPGDGASNYLGQCLTARRTNWPFPTAAVAGKTTDWFHGAGVTCPLSFGSEKMSECDGWPIRCP